MERKPNLVGNGNKKEKKNTSSEKEEHNLDYHRMKKQGSCKLNDNDRVIKVESL